MIKNNDEMKTLLTRKNGGLVTCNFKDINSSEQTNVKERFVDEIGFKSYRIKNNWTQIDRSMANEIMKYILSVNMAYDVEIETKPFANEVISYFFEQFSFSTEFYTNGDFYESDGLFRLRGWKPITDFIFDTGVLAMDKHIIGILWAADND